MVHLHKWEVVMMEGNKIGTGTLYRLYLSSKYSNKLDKLVKRIEKTTRRRYLKWINKKMFMALLWAKREIEWEREILSKGRSIEEIERDLDMKGINIENSERKLKEKGIKFKDIKRRQKSEGYSYKKILHKYKTQGRSQTKADGDLYIELSNDVKKKLDNTSR